MIPQEVAELTPAFFAEALQRDVAPAELVDQHSGTTGRSRFRLSGDPTLPATVFVKLAPFDARQRKFVAAVGMGVAEARFYRDLAPEVPVRVPRPYHAGTDGERYVMVLEDLEASGCRFPGPGDPDIERRGGDIVEQLAALHAKYWESTRFDDDLGWLARTGAGISGGGGRRCSCRWPSTPSATISTRRFTGSPTTTLPTRQRSCGCGIPDRAP